METPKPTNIFALQCFVTGQIEYCAPDENAVYAVWESIPDYLRHYFAIWEYAPLRNYDYFGHDNTERKVVPNDIKG